jgi:hypothetical protein
VEKLRKRQGGGGKKKKDKRRQEKVERERYKTFLTKEKPVDSVKLSLGNAALLTRTVIIKLTWRREGGGVIRRKTGEGDIGHGECFKEFVLA